jgi:hypothetical protein
MRVQFKCCLCGQLNVIDLKSADELAPPSRGLVGAIKGLFGSKPKAKPRYTVQCEFCSQNNKISAPASRSASRAQRPSA